MKGVPDTTVAMRTATDREDDTLPAAVATIAAVAGDTPIVDWICYSYAGAGDPAATGVVTIEEGTTTIWTHNVSDEGLMFFKFPGGGLVGTEGATIVATLNQIGADENKTVNIGIR